MIVLYAGNTYKLPIQLSKDQAPILSTDVKAVEFSIGTIVKKYPEDVTYDQDSKAFIVSLTQEDTIALCTKKQMFFQARILFNDDSVKCTARDTIEIMESVSKEVLK